MYARVSDYQTPLRMLSRFHSIPSVLNLCPRIFVCICYVHVHSHVRDKLDPRALKEAINVSTLLQGNTMSLWMFNSMRVSLIFLRMWTWFLFKGRLIIRKRRDYGWKKRGGGFQVRERTWNWMIHERPDILFQQHYSRKNKDTTTGGPSPSLDAPLNDITMPSDDPSKIDSEVQNSSPLTSESIALNPQSDQRRRYPLCSHKEPDKFGFSKPSSNVVYPISDFVSYHRLSKAHLGFALQFSSMSIPSHFQEALEDPKWKSAMVEEMKAFQKNCT